MSYREWQAVIQLGGLVAVTAWLLTDVPAGGLSVAAAAGRALWAIGALVVFNIVATIVVGILIGIARQQELKEERADERDRAIETRSSRNGYLVTSGAAALALLPLAFGAEPALAVYALLAAPMLGGGAHAASMLVYYRIS
jgi:Cu/Ag efflux pump CusA